MPHPTNTPDLDEVASLSLSEIAALPPELLHELQEVATEATTRLRRLRERLEAGIAQRYTTATDVLRHSLGKTSGTVRIEDGGMVVIADLPKKVAWDQERLAAMAERIRAAGEDPREYLEITYRVPERRFTAWPEALREGFAAARSETTGKPVFRLEPLAGR